MTGTPVSKAVWCAIDGSWVLTFRSCLHQHNKTDEFLSLAQPVEAGQEVEKHYGARFVSEFALIFRVKMTATTHATQIG